jgi:hypothetical protein
MPSKAAAAANLSLTHLIQADQDKAEINRAFARNEEAWVDACARRYGVELLERDRHFAMIAHAIKG